MKPLYILIIFFVSLKSLFAQAALTQESNMENIQSTTQDNAQQDLPKEKVGETSNKNAALLKFDEKSTELFLNMLESEYKARGEELKIDGYENDAANFFNKSLAAKNRDATHYNENTFSISPAAKLEAELAGIFFDRLRGNTAIFDLFPESLARMQSYYDCMLVEMRDAVKKRSFCTSQFDKMQKTFQRAGYTKNINYQKDTDRESLSVYFDLGSSVVKPSYITLIKKKINEVAKDKKYKILITGLADKTGNKSLNYKISKQRAENVKAELLKSGVREHLISLDYLGDNYSLIKTEKAEKFNRRVVVDIIIYE